MEFATPRCYDDFHFSSSNFSLGVEFRAGACNCSSFGFSNGATTYMRPVLAAKGNDINNYIDLPSSQSRSDTCFVCL